MLVFSLPSFLYAFIPLIHILKYAILDYAPIDLYFKWFPHVRIFFVYLLCLCAYLSGRCYNNAELYQSALFRIGKPIYYPGWVRQACRMDLRYEFLYSKAFQGVICVIGLICSTCYLSTWVRRVMCLLVTWVHEKYLVVMEYKHVHIWHTERL